MISNKSVKVTIFFTEIICMILEVCASYLFSPYFGSSNYVWTGIIGVILLSNSIGNYIGGTVPRHISDGNNNIKLDINDENMLSFILPSIK